MDMKYTVVLDRSNEVIIRNCCATEKNKVPVQQRHSSKKNSRRVGIYLYDIRPGLRFKRNLYLKIN